MPESRVVDTNSQDSFVKVDGSSGRQAGSADLQAVIENRSASSSTQSLFFHEVPQSPVSPATETWTANKQLSFSSDQRAVEELDGKQLGERSSIHAEPHPLSEVENAGGLESFSCTNAGTQEPLLQQSQVDAQEDELNCKIEENFQDDEAGPHQIIGDVSEQCLSEPQIPVASSLVSAVKEPAQLETEVEEDCDSVRSNMYSLEAPSYAKPSPVRSSKRSPHVLSQKYKQKLLGLLRREKEKPSHVQSPQKKRLVSQQKDYRSAADTTVDKSKSAQIVEARSITLTALQNTPFKETLISSDADPWQEGSVSQAQFSKTASDLKEFGMTEKRDLNILPREETKHVDTHCHTEIAASQGLQTNSDVRNINNDVLPQKETTMEDSAGKPQPKQFPPQTDQKMFVDLSKDDGTYRAHPVFVYDEMNDSLAGSVTDLHISELQDESVTCPVPPVSFITPKPEQNIPVSLLTQSSFTSQSDTVAEISNKEVSPQSDRRISSENREKSEEESQLNQHKNKPFAVTSSKMTDRPDLGSFDSSVDTKLPCRQDTESQERHLSPSKSARPKDKDDKVKWSPSKTYHPKVLPRESSSGKGSKLEGSPLKTFPIEIDPKAKVAEEQQGSLTAVPRQKKSPSHVTKQAALTDTKDNTSSLLLPHPADGETCFSHVNTQRTSNTSTSPHSKEESRNKVENFTSLHRSFIPKDNQHYLGPTERAHSPPFHHDKAESDAGHRPQRALLNFLGNQSDNPTERNPDWSSWNVQSKDENASQDATTRTWSLSRANSGSELSNSDLTDVAKS
ncbi:uncharacterized protein [Leuresthes tenuis]|uniref:uncharacterized protein isoform X1 n=1 Tax=Leuresthes tenuis TaxID=355514 RepID=UPI003B510955